MISYYEHVWGKCIFRTEKWGKEGEKPETKLSAVPQSTREDFVEGERNVFMDLTALSFRG